MVATKRVGGPRELVENCGACDFASPPRIKLGLSGGRPGFFCTLSLTGCRRLTGNLGSSGGSVRRRFSRHDSRVQRDWCMSLDAGRLRKPAETQSSSAEVPLDKGSLGRQRLPAKAVRPWCRRSSADFGSPRTILHQIIGHWSHALRNLDPGVGVRFRRMNRKLGTGKFHAAEISVRRIFLSSIFVSIEFLGSGGTSGGTSGGFLRRGRFVAFVRQRLLMQFG